MTVQCDCKLHLLTTLKCLLVDATTDSNLTRAWWISTSNTSENFQYRPKGWHYLPSNTLDTYCFPVPCCKLLHSLCLLRSKRVSMHRCCLLVDNNQSFSSCSSPCFICLLPMQERLSLDWLEWNPLRWIQELDRWQHFHLVKLAFRDRRPWRLRTLCSSCFSSNDDD